MSPSGAPLWMRAERALPMSTDSPQPPSAPDHGEPRFDRGAPPGEPGQDAADDRSAERLQRSQKLIGDYSRYGTAGIQFAAYLTLCILGGFWLDRKLGTSPLLLVAGVLMGFGVGLYSLMKKFPISKRRKAIPPSTQDDPPAEP